MAFKFIVVACFVTFTNAGFLGEPILGYSATPVLRSDYIQQANIPIGHAAPLAIHNPTYGSSHQSVERSLGGAQSISHYSKAIDSAFSSVRKYDTRITNDALSVAHAPIVAKQLAPAVAYSGAPIVAKAVAPIAYSGPAIAYSSAPAVSSSYIHHAQPLLAKAVAPVAAYAPLLTKSISAPVVSTYSSPLITKSIAAPLVSAYSAPLVTKSIATPVISAYSAPVSKAAIAYSPATVVAHTTFTGLGTAYEW